MGIVATGGSSSSGITTRVYDAATGAELWNANHGAAVYGITADAAGNVYTVGARTSNITTRKYDSNGTLLWSADHGGAAWEVAVDSNGNVYTVGARTSNITTRKYDSSGTEDTSNWQKDHGGTVYGLAIDSSDNVYTAGVYTSSINVRKYNSSGTQQWTNFHGVDLYSIAILGSYYVAGGVLNTADNKTTRAGTNSTGAWNYFYDHGGSVNSVAQAANSSGTRIDSIVSGGARVSSITTRQFPRTTGADTWTADHGANVIGVCVDYSDGSVYTVGAASSEITTRKYNYNGVEITDDDWPLNHGAIVNCVAWSPYTLGFSRIPALSIPLGLATPTATFFHQIPALAISLALGLPDSTPTPLPPDLAGVAYPSQQIYRAYLTGGASLLELPMSGLQCRRRLNESTWLDVEIPTYSAALAAEIAGVATRELVIYAGYLIEGVETLGEMMRATLTEIRNEREGGRGSMRLTARVIPTTATVTSHQLIGVRQRGRDDQGRRTVACAVNPLVRPNHTANDGLHTFTVGSMTYRISPADATMWLVEAG